MRKIVSLMLCAILVMALVVPAFASETEPLVITETEGTPAQTQPPHEHSWVEGSSKAPTCTEAGSKTYTCTCGETKTESIAATGHTLTETVTKNPTCTAAGEKTKTCSVCGYSGTESIAATGHSFGDLNADANGHTKTCTVCGAVESSEHSWAEEFEVLLPTCTEAGEVRLACTICGGYIYEPVPALGHTYDSVCDAECNVCGAVREASHKFSTAWSKDASGHWHVCSKCGEKADIGKHYPGPAATEEKAQLCLTCGYTLTAKLNHVHEYEKKWTSDVTGHWYACTGCEEQKDFQDHVFDDLCDPDCNICGYVADTAHSYEEEWQYDESGHWSVCILCGSESGLEAHTTDPETGLCTVCGYEGEIPETTEHIHEFAEEWLSDDESHWQECECGETSEAVPHVWDEGTENEDGTVTYVCEECQAERVEEAEETPGGFPWWIVFTVLVIALIGAVVALIFVLKPKKKGKFSD